MAAVRYSGGMSDDFRPDGVSYATRRKGDVCVSKREGVTWQFLGRIPQGCNFVGIGIEDYNRMYV